MNRLAGKVALVTGGTRGIGRAIVAAFLAEGASVVFCGSSQASVDAAREALPNHASAEGIAVDLADASAPERLAAAALARFGRIDILVNHAGTQMPVDSPDEITSEIWDGTIKTNLYGPWWSTHEALKHMGEGASIINTGSVNGLRGNKSLIDYSASKGGIHVLTMALAQALVDRGIRVNCVAPGPVWSPLIVATFDEEKVEEFGQQVPMGRAAQPDEIAPSYVFFAANELSSYYTGEVLAPIGGETTPG
jgi:NAD(P)-dependent dehydrogenase (short-subunit alcohol dehydrogenase family)